MTTSGSSSSDGGVFSSFRATAGRTSADAARVYRVFASQPSWALKLGASLAAVMIVAVTLLLIVPAIVVFMLVMLLGAAVQRLRSLLPRRKSPVRDIEGRKNVRVIGREQY